MNWISTRFSVYCNKYGSQFRFNCSRKLTEMIQNDSTATPESILYIRCLRNCLRKKDLTKGKAIHGQLLQKGFLNDSRVCNALITMYAKLGRLADGRNVFGFMPHADVYCWTVMISAYVGHGFHSLALQFFLEMQKSDVRPNHFTFASILPACANLVALCQGMQIHSSAFKLGFSSDLVVMNALLDMYAKSRVLQYAQQLFDEMSERDTVSWTSLVSGYACSGFFDEAWMLFNQMPSRNVVSWNAMITALIQNGWTDKAFYVFRQMIEAGIVPDTKTLVSVCSIVVNLDHGKQIHAKMIVSGFLPHLFAGNSLISMYSKCRNIENSSLIFEKMKERDLVTWNSMITGYAQNGFMDEALRVFDDMDFRDSVSWSAIIAGFAQNGQGTRALYLLDKMQLSGIEPDSKVFASVLSACANLAALQKGICIHNKIIKKGLEADTVVMTALLDMYAQCGSLEASRNLFENMTHKDLVAWNAMIAGYAMHGHGKEALQIFQEMKNFGHCPDHVSLVNVLTACSHSGLVDEGFRHFKSITEYYGKSPRMEHYMCVIDTLGRAGRLEDAKNILEKVPLTPEAIPLWNCFLGACRTHNQAELGEYTANKLFVLQPKDPSPYVTLSDICAAVG